MGRATARGILPPDSHPYRVPRPLPGGDGVPRILDLRDFTGSGLRSDFALFEYVACGIVSTSVVGYQTAHDQLIQYPIEERDPTTGKTKQRLWINQVFAWQPVRPGFWQFDWRPGHGSDDVVHAKVRFDQARQVFLSETTLTGPPAGK